MKTVNKQNIGTECTKKVLLANAFLILGYPFLGIASVDIKPAETKAAKINKHTSAIDVSNQFIITVSPNADPVSIAQSYGLQPEYVYTSVLHGFSAKMPELMLNQIQSDVHIMNIEPDQIVTKLDAQSNVTWGLDRIDSRVLPLDSTYQYNFTGHGVTAYVIDTGIRLTHSEYSDRTTFGFDAFGGDGTDCNGHGTHVAGTIGGSTYGVAKQVSLVAVRVLDCNGSGSISGVIAGLDWVKKNHSDTGNIAVANMSLGGGASSSFDTALRNLIESGVSTAVAAGNSTADACSSSPSRVKEAITVGASDSSDIKASWSNYGDCVDWFAPGVKITSSWNDSDTDTNIISGTSMASPHTAGVAALYLQNHPKATPDEVQNALLSFATKNIISSSKTTQNHLLYSIEKTTASDTTKPRSKITSPIDGSKVTRKASVTIAADAWDNRQVTKVEFYVNESLICTDPTSSYECKWLVPDSSRKTYKIQAISYDPNGNTGTSPTVRVKVS